MLPCGRGVSALLSAGAVGRSPGCRAGPASQTPRLGCSRLGPSPLAPLSPCAPGKPCQLSMPGRPRSPLLTVQMRRRSPCGKRLAQVTAREGGASLGRPCCSPGGASHCQAREERGHTALSLVPGPCPGRGTTPLSRILASHAGRIPSRPGSGLGASWRLPPSATRLSCSPARASDRRAVSPPPLCLHASPAWGRRSLCPGPSSCGLPSGPGGPGAQGQVRVFFSRTGQGAGRFPSVSRNRRVKLVEVLGLRGPF